MLLNSFAKFSQKVIDSGVARAIVYLTPNAQASADEECVAPVTVLADPNGVAPTYYASPDGRGVGVSGNLGVLFSDDFGGSAIDTNILWDVLDGGLGANPTLGAGTLIQAAIGTGTTGITHSVSSSNLSVVMGTVNNAEKWFLSKKVFAGSEDITVLLSRSQALAANSIFIGLVEVDLATGIPLLNQNLAADFTNRGGVEFGATTGSQQAALQAVADSSNNVASVSQGTFAPAAMSTPFLTTIQFRAKDLIASSQVVDSVAGTKTSNAMSVSTQCPNDTKAYKLLMRFKNIAAPGSSTTVAISRILVEDKHTLDVNIDSGSGDTMPGMSVPVTLTTSIPAGGNVIGALGASASGTGALSMHKLLAAATTNATSVKTSAGKLYGGMIYNFSASIRYLKFYNKASAPTVGTDVPPLTIPIPPGASLGLSQVLPPDIGLYFGTGLAYAITAAVADSDNTAVAAGDVQVNLLYA